MWMWLCAARIVLLAGWKGCRCRTAARKHRDKKKVKKERRGKGCSFDGACLLLDALLWLLGPIYNTPTVQRHHRPTSTTTRSRCGAGRGPSLVNLTVRLNFWSFKSQIQLSDLFSADRLSSAWRIRFWRLLTWSRRTGRSVRTLLIDGSPARELRLVDPRCSEVWTLLPETRASKLLGHTSKSATRPLIGSVAGVTNWCVSLWSDWTVSRLQILIPVWRHRSRFDFLPAARD